MYALLTIFPFSFELPMLNAMVRLGLLLAIAGIIIGIIVETVRILTGNVNCEP